MAKARLFCSPLCRIFAPDLMNAENSEVAEAGDLLSNITTSVNEASQAIVDIDGVVNQLRAPINDVIRSVTGYFFRKGSIVREDCQRAYFWDN